MLSRMRFFLFIFSVLLPVECFEWILSLSASASAAAGNNRKPPPSRRTSSSLLSSASVSPSHLLLLVIIIAMVSPTEGLKCVQCTTDLDPNCLARVKASEAKECADPNMKYCITMVEYAKNETRSVFDISASSPPPSYETNKGKVLFVGRSCMSYFTGNDCNEGIRTEASGLKKNIIVCKKYCSTDACNHGQTLTASFLIALPILLLLLSSSSTLR